MARRIQNYQLGMHDYIAAITEGQEEERRRREELHWKRKQAEEERLALEKEEREVAAALEYEFKRRGASGPSFDTIVLFGARSSLPHGQPAGRRDPAGMSAHDFENEHLGLRHRADQRYRSLRGPGRSAAGRARRRQRSAVSHAAPKYARMP